MFPSPFSPYDPSAGKVYPNVDPLDIERVEIFPPIGIARVGDSGTLMNGQLDHNHPQIEYFYGPEAPGLDDHPFGSFRDPQGRIRRQAARFRVYAYDNQGNILGEINNTQGYRLTWTVHVANKKAAYTLSRGRISAPVTDLRNPDVDPVDNPPPSGEPFDPSLESRKKLIIDPGLKTIVRDKTDSEPVPLNGKFQGSTAKPIEVNLGELRTDSHGRLVFLAGSGHSRSVQTQQYSFQEQPEIISEFDSVDWYDNTCDGWVSVSVYHPSLDDELPQLKSLHKATIICAPPKFAWGIHSPTSLHDIIEDMYHKHCGQYYEELSGTDFFKHIWPVLSGTYKLSWVNKKASQGHGPDAFGNFWIQRDNLSSKDPRHKALRNHIFGRLRQPDYENKDQAHVILMPRLSGDGGDAIEPGTVPSHNGMSIERFSALTALQYERFRKWKDGDFTVGTPFGTKTSIEEYDLQEQPAALTRAALEHTIGDPLYPGIETYWIVKQRTTFCMQTSNDEMPLHPPFRVNHDTVLPGFLTRGLSLPWQSDFSLCNTHWWPSARPDDVVVLHVSLKDEESLAKWLSTANLSALLRRKWTRGLRDTPDDLSFFPGSTDMVHQWQNLGFVTKFEPDQRMPPVWLEVERNPITRPMD